MYFSPSRVFYLQVLVVLYSPSFLPGSLYRLKYVACEYIYKLPKAVAKSPAEPGSGGDASDKPADGDKVKETAPVSRSINVVVTQYPDQYNEGSKVVFSRLINTLPRLALLVESNIDNSKDIF
jgi:hypothetical protein